MNARRQEGSMGDPDKTSTPSDVPSAERISLARDVPIDWIDRLLLARAAIPPGADLSDSAGHLLALGRELLDDVALGVCIPNDGGDQIVVRQADRSSHVGAPDPARLFPELTWERSIAVPGDEGSTLHVASNDKDRLGATGSAAGVFLDRLALMLGSVIQARRAVDRGRSPELRRLQDQVIQLEKLASLGQMVAGIVHELNNPLTSIVAYADYLRKKAERNGGDPGDVDRLARINEAAERILRFSRDLTEYSRPKKVVPAPVPINEVIDRALVFCEHELDKTGVMVERNLGDVHPVRGVAGQLTQVFVNLFTNAAHAMRDQGGLLTITTSMSRDDEVEVVITDDGHGIDDDTLPKIFDPFFTTKTDGSGTGLGLSIVRSIVVNHGGRIRAAGNTPKGTVFHLDLPVAALPKGEE
jgi:two-component system, NtrC family, sensor kinase